MSWPNLCENLHAAAMLAALADHQGIGWWDEATSRLVIAAGTDLLPSCLQFAFRQIVLAAQVEGGLVAAGGPVLIRGAFKSRIRPNDDQEFYHQFDERIGD